MDEGYEYGGGGPEYMFEGLTRGGAGIFKVAETVCLWLYEFSVFISKEYIVGLIDGNGSLSLS